MAYTGTRSAGESIVDAIHFYSAAAVTAAQIITECYVAHDGRIGGIAAGAVTAGVGAGNTVLDVQVNGVSIYGAVGNQPTLASASTGLFTNAQAKNRFVRKGDRLTVLVTSIPATTGHARVSGEVCIEDA